MFDNPEKRRERSRIGVDAADAEEVQMHGTGQMILAVVLDRTQIDEQGRPGFGELAGKLHRRDEQRHRSETIS